jgi:hypothetical protein
VKRHALLVLGAGAFVLYALSAPSVVNGDGLGYLRPLKWSVTPQPVPGHLLYIPLLRLLRRLSGGHTLEAARLVNALAGAFTVVLAHGVFRRFVEDARAALVAAAGLACSWGLWSQAADVETYALALLFQVAAVHALARWQARPSPAIALQAGVLAALATLFHVTHVLFLPCVAVWILTAGEAPRRARVVQSAVAVGAAGLVIAAGYLTIVFLVLHKTPAQAWTWFRAAGHGFVYLIRPYNFTDALQGLARALVYAPYAQEADPSVVIGQLLLGGAALAALVGPAIARRASLPPLPRAALLAWALPYAILGFLFFGTDPERWVFVLPLLWLLFAAARAPRLGRALAGTLLVLNVVTAALPGVTEIGPRWRARAVEALVDPGDLVIFPGHDWDEYVGYYDERYVRVFPLAYYVGAYGVDGALDKLEQTIAFARARAGQVYVVRVLEDNPGQRGWDELALLDFPRERAAAWLRARGDVTELEPVRGVRVFRLEPQKSEAR